MEGMAAMAKKLAVTIRLEMDVPDSWEVVRTADGVEILQLAPDQFMDLTFEPMVTRDVEGEWSNAVSDEFMDELLDMVESEVVTYDIQQLQ